MNQNLVRVVVTDPDTQRVGWTGTVTDYRKVGHADTDDPMVLVLFDDYDPHFNGGDIPFSLWYEPHQVQSLGTEVSA